MTLPPVFLLGAIRLYFPRPAIGRIAATSLSLSSDFCPLTSPLMAKRNNHYESAFESYLRARRVAYVAVDEKRRSLVGAGSLKNLDFIVSPSDTVSLLVDIKGRRFPSGQRQKQYWRNWSRWDDLEGLAAWQEKIGRGSYALLVFAYLVVGDRAPVPVEHLFEYQQQRYAFLAVRVADYIRFARRLSRRWQTVTMPSRMFRQAAFRFDELLEPSESFLQAVG